MMSGPKIAIVHNKIRHYRLPFFQALSKEFNTNYYLFEEKSGEYPLKVNFVKPIQLFHEILRENYDIVVLPDYVFIEAWIAGIAASITGSRIVSWTEVWDMPHTPIWKRVLKWSLAFMMGMVADSFVVPGKKSQEFLQDIPHIHHENIFRAPNAMNLPENEDSDLGTFDINTDKHIVLYLGQLIERKRIQDIIRAIELIETSAKVELWIGGAGDEEYTEYLRDIANQETVSFLGWVPEAEIRHLYETADVYVLPSLQDPYPLTVIEAMACGTPVVISNGVGQAGDIVRQGETGEIVPTKSPQNLAEKLEKVLNDPEYKAELSTTSREIVSERVTYNKMVDGFRQAIIRANN